MKALLILLTFLPHIMVKATSCQNSLSKLEHIANSIPYVRLATPIFWRKLSDEIKPKSPVQSKTKITKKTLDKEMNESKKRLKKMGVKFKASDYQHNQEHINYYETTNEIKKHIQNKDFILEITATPTVSKEANALSPALQHPLFKKHHEEIKKAGHKLVIDTTQKSFGMAGYLHSEKKILSISPTLSYSSFIHEMRHFWNKKNGRKEKSINLKKEVKKNISPKLEEVFGKKVANKLRQLKDFSEKSALEERAAVEEQKRSLGLRRFNPYTEEFSEAIWAERYALSHLINDYNEMSRINKKKNERVYKKAKQKLKRLVVYENLEIELLTLPSIPIGQFIIYNMANMFDSNEQNEEEKNLIIKDTKTNTFYQLENK